MLNKLQLPLCTVPVDLSAIHKLGSIFRQALKSAVSRDRSQRSDHRL